MPHAFRLTALALLLTACPGGDGPAPVPPTAENLVGTWDLEALYVALDTNPSIRFDRVKDGYDETLTITPNATFTMDWVIIGGGTPTDAGPVTLVGDTVVLTFTGIFAGQSYRMFVRVDGREMTWISTAPGIEPRLSGAQEVIRGTRKWRRR